MSRQLTLSCFDDAGPDPDRWRDSLGAIAAEFGGLAGGVRVEAPDGAVTQTWCGLSEAFERAYLDHYHRLDPWMPTARSRPVGRCAPSEDFVPGHVLDSSEFYQDFLKPHGLREIVGGIADRSPDGGITTFALMRADGAPSFDRSDAARLEPFLPRIRRALWIDQRLSELETAGAESNVAVLVLDSDGLIRSRNQAAEALLRSGDAITSAQNRLRATCPVSDATLSLLLRDARPGFNSGNSTKLQAALRRSKGPALIASVSTLSERVSSARVDGPRPGVLVVIHDPLCSIDLGLVESKLRSLYGLTAAEARVAALVGSGHSASQAALPLRITPGTARFQLKQIYAATGLSSQRELVRLVALLSRL